MGAVVVVLVAAVAGVGAIRIGYRRADVPARNLSSTSTCTTLAHLDAGTGPDVIADPYDVMAVGQLAPLPVAGLPPASVHGTSVYSAAARYLAETAVDDPGLWRDRMATDHFVGAFAVGYQAGDDLWGAEALRFATTAQAEDFLRTTLARSCELGYLSHPQAVPGVSGGVGYLYQFGGDPPYNSEFVVGSTVVHLNICECVQSLDPAGLTVAWGVAVAHQLGRPRRGPRHTGRTPARMVAWLSS